MSVAEESSAAGHKPAKQRRSREKVELILATALDMLSDGPADRISTNEIAKAAGISIGSLYQFFASKEAIYYELYRRWLADTLAAMNRVDERFDGSEGLPAYADAMFESLSKDEATNSRGHWQLRFAMGSSPELDELEKAHNDEVFRRIVATQKKFGQDISVEEAKVLARLRHKVVVACLSAVAEAKSAPELALLQDWCRTTIHLVYDVQQLRATAEQRNC